MNLPFFVVGSVNISGLIDFISSANSGTCTISFNFLNLCC